MNVIWTITKTVIFGTGLWVWGLVAKEAIEKQTDEPIVKPIMVMYDKADK